MLNIATKDGPKAVESLGELNIYGARCFAHQRNNTPGWFAVAEYATGKQIGVGETIQAAQTQARCYIKMRAKQTSSNPRRLLEESIKQELAQHGAVNEPQEGA